MLAALAVLCLGALIMTAAFLLALARPWERRDSSPAREGLPAESYWLYDDQYWYGINVPPGARPPAWDGEQGQRVPHSPCLTVGIKDCAS